MLKIGNMLWRIGEILDIDQQMEWTRKAGFGGVGFSACAGISGEWRGIEPASCDAKELKRLREKIGRFSFSEIHTPFVIELRNETLTADIAALIPILEFAHDLDVGVVTVHALFPGSDTKTNYSSWLVPMQELNEKAIRLQTKVVLEIVSGFDVVKSWGLSNVGINLDVGHMYLSDNIQTLKAIGGIGKLIKFIGDSLMHLHMHDVTGNTDHIEIGTGIISFEEIAAALYDINYPYNLMLEMNPDRVTPEGVRRSAEYLNRCLHTAGIE